MEWKVDRTAGWLGVAFLVTLLGSEAVLSLPDETASPAAVVGFYDEHRGFIIVLQIVGLISAALLALLAWRLGVVDRRVSIAGLILAATALAPAVITLIIALVADPASPGRADTYNHLEPRGDDLLFVGILLFAGAITLLRAPGWLRVIAAIVVLTCLLRFTLELLGQPRGALDALAPITFLVLVAAQTWLSFRGRREAA
jgi:hypothetical protein